MTVRRLESVHRLRYFRFCNVLHIWTIRAIPTYRVYRLYDIYSRGQGNASVLVRILALGRLSMEQGATIAISSAEVSIF